LPIRRAAFSIVDEALAPVVPAQAPAPMVGLVGHIGGDRLLEGQVHIAVGLQAPRPDTFDEIQDIRLCNYWKKIRSENFTEADESQQRKNRRKEWLEWYSKSKSEKEGF